MLDWLDPFVRSDAANWKQALLSVSLAFALAQAVAGIYVFTFRGMSYSRNLVQGMALAAVVTCTLMLAIGDSIAAGIGIAGGLSIIRFRATMRDPRDMVFLFAALAAGIATGLQAFPTAIAGTLAFCVAALMLHWTGYGARKEFDALLRFAAPPDADELIAKILRKYCTRFTLVTLREVAQGSMLEHAYHVNVPNPAARSQLLASLQQLSGVRDAVLLLQEPTLEL
jgi:uncharacterized membrane protein YhiD involved in acid resistance